MEIPHSWGSRFARSIDLNSIWDETKEQQLRDRAFATNDRDEAAWNQGKSYDEKAFLLGLIPNRDKRYRRGHNLTHNLLSSISNHEIAQSQPGFLVLGYAVFFFRSFAFSSYLLKRKDRSQIKKCDPREWLSPVPTIQTREQDKEWIAQIASAGSIWLSTIGRVDINVMVSD